ncbi:MAG: hypothetical protein ACJ761_08610 [Chloroflexota bacterium]
MPTLTRAVPPIGWDEAGADRRVRDDHAGYWEGYLEDLVAILEEPA